jgi:nucleotide-binding universal stress UspA family protein
MANFKKILFPVDLSGVSTNLIDTVKAMVRAYDAELHVMYVARTFEPYRGFPHNIASLEDAQYNIVDGSTQSLDKFVSQNLGGLRSVQNRVAIGHTAREILDYIQKSGVDLVILGTHGRWGLGKILFGSVAQRVVESSQVPVMTIKPRSRKDKEIDWLTPH